MSRFPFQGDEPIAGHWQIEGCLFPDREGPSWWWRICVLIVLGWEWIDIDRTCMRGPARRIDGTIDEYLS